jgi:hypothetical protein
MKWFDLDVPFAWEHYSPDYRSRDYSLAIHESSHAVLIEHFGYQVQNVELNGPMGCADGNLLPGRNNIVRYAVIAYAGLVAARRAVNDEHAKSYAAHDFDFLTQALSSLNVSGKVKRRISRIAEKICERLVEQHWTDIQNVAVVLADKKRLSGAEVRNILAEVR